MYLLLRNVIKLAMLTRVKLILFKLHEYGKGNSNVQSIVILRCYYYESVIKLHSLLLRVQRGMNIWYLTCTRE